MDNFTDLALLKHFADEMERDEQPEPEELGELLQVDSMFSAEAYLLQALEIEILEKSLEEKTKSLEN